MTSMTVRPAQPDDLGELESHLPLVDGLSHAAYLNHQAEGRGVYLTA